MISILRSFSLFITLIYLTNVAPAQPDENITDTYISGDHTYNISVALDHIFISKKNNSIEVSEIVVFRNEGEEIYYSKDNHTFFAISTPSDIRNLKTPAMECCLVQEEGTVYMDPMRSIAKGDDFEMQISYAIMPGDQDYVFNKSAIYNTTAISIFADKKSGIELRGRSEVMILSGNEYDVVTFNNIGAGKNVSLPVQLTSGSGDLYKWAGGGLLLAVIAVVYYFRDRIPWKRKKEATLEELENEKINIFRTIHGFEKHAGSEHSEEYQKLMEEYRQKTIKIFIEIDKLKNKVKNEPIGTETNHQK